MSSKTKFFFKSVTFKHTSVNDSHYLAGGVKWRPVAEKVMIILGPLLHII
jgi:hypothetical protein